MSTSIEPGGKRRRLRAFAAAVVFLAAASGGLAHVLPGAEGNREIVRLQGYREKLPPGQQTRGEIVLSILGEDHEFHLTDWRRFRLTDEEAPGETDPSRFSLQAERAVLVKITGARPEQRVTILGERRLNGPDIFVLALDLCPPE